MVNSDSNSEEADMRLLLRASRGDAKAFQDLHARYHRQVRGFAGVVGAGLAPDLLDEAVQETFLRLWRGAAAFRGEVSVRTYLFSITRHTVFEMIRRERRQRSGQLQTALKWAGRLDGPEAAAEELAENAIGTAAEHARSQLSPAQWAAMYLVLLKGLTPREAAKAIGCSSAAVYDRLYRARLKLRKDHRSLSDAIQKD